MSCFHPCSSPQKDSKATRRTDVIVGKRDLASRVERERDGRQALVRLERVGQRVELERPVLGARQHVLPIVVAFPLCLSIFSISALQR